MFLQERDIMDNFMMTITCAHDHARMLYKINRQILCTHAHYTVFQNLYLSQEENRMELWHGLF